MAKAKAPVGEGAKAPRFTLTAHDGTKVKAADLDGTPYVLFFYPKADTPGCTAETCGFRDAWAVFGKAGVRVFGVSPDPQAKQARFAAKFAVPFPLLCDTEQKLAQAYGCWVEKSMYGRTYMGIERSTFLVGAGGKVAKAWRKVKVAGHVEDVLAAAQTL